jgi:hypothetical protein
MSPGGKKPSRRDANFPDNVIQRGFSPILSEKDRIHRHSNHLSVVLAHNASPSRAPKRLNARKQAI